MFDAKWKYDAELDPEGRVLGTGPDRFIPRINISLFILNYLILSVFLGSGLSHFLLKSPLVNLVGRLLGFVIVQAMRVVTVGYWFVTGHKAPLVYFKEAPNFGTPEIKGVGFVGLILLIALIIGIRSYRNSFVPAELNQHILVVNAAFFIILSGLLILF